jgi:hypothetical protein
MKLIVSSQCVYKYVVEYLSTFEGYLPVIYENLFNHDLHSCDEIIFVQWEIWKWLPDYVFQLPIKISILNTEQLVYQSHKESLFNSLNQLQNKCGYQIKVYDYSKTNCDILHAMGFIPEYHEYVSTKEENTFLTSLHTLDKEYDVGFCGGMIERRERILQELKNRGMKVLIVDNWGKERDIELAKCKYIVNIHYFDEYKIFEALRCNRWIQAGFNIISEESMDIYENDNLFVCSYDNFVDYAVKLLQS